MGNMSLDSAPAAAQLASQPPRRSYIPPHMRGKMDAANNGPMPVNAPPVNGLNQSAWAG